MPIRPIKPPVPEGGEPAAPTPRAKIESPPPRRRPSPPASPVTAKVAARSGESASQQRANGKDPREQKSTNQKRQPTGDYEVGFAKTPIKSRFQAGNKGGPGRPNGLKSQDTYLRKELNEQRMLRVNGVERKISNRELATKLLVETALKKQDIKHLELLLLTGVGSFLTLHLLMGMMPHSQILRSTKQSYVSSSLDCRWASLTQIAQALGPTSSISSRMDAMLKASSATKMAPWKTA